MPEQPLSSRLSLAQAVTSMNSKSKALHIGIDTGTAAEDEGWGEGQPLVRIMMRDVRVMKRWGYEWEEPEPDADATVKQEDSTQTTLKSSQDTLAEQPPPKDPALWAIDLEALKKSSQPAPHGAVKSYKSAHASSTAHLPIYTAQSARAYLLKAFESPPSTAIKSESAPSTSGKRTAAAMAAEKARNLALLLGALELLYESWAMLGKEDLDKRAWGWYVRVRPEVASGPAGWGGKGEVRLKDVLALRRPEG